MRVKAFKTTGIRVYPEEKGRNLLEDLINSIELDMILFGEPGTILNYQISYKFYNPKYNKLFIVLQAEIEKYESGEKVKLIPLQMSTDDYEEVFGPQG